MNPRVFETKNAKYYLGLGRHDTSSNDIFRDINFSDLDLIVFESGSCDDSAIIDLLCDVQYEELYARIIEENPEIGVYDVDTIIPSVKVNMISAFLDGSISALGLLFAYRSGKQIIKNRKNITRRDFFKHMAVVSGGTLLGTKHMLLINAISSDEIIPSLGYCHSIRTNLLPTPLDGFREAVTAKKVSEYLVPKYKQEGRKTQVALLYGPMHTGIEMKIKHPWISDVTIWLYHDLLKQCSKKELNSVRQVVIGDDKRRRVVYEYCKLF